VVAVASAAEVPVAVASAVVEAEAAVWAVVSEVAAAVETAVAACSVAEAATVQAATDAPEWDRSGSEAAVLVADAILPVAAVAAAF
jgi:hypothetical protein